MEERKQLTITDSILHNTADLMRQAERDPVKRSQHRNMRFLSVTPELPIPLMIMRYISEEPIARVSNQYGQRVQTSQRAFIPFKFSRELSCSAIVCTEKLMAYYQSAAAATNVSALYISNSKQIKALGALENMELLLALQSYQVVVITPQRLKEFASVLQQQCTLIASNFERTAYQKLLSQLSDLAPSNQLANQVQTQISSLLEQEHAPRQDMLQIMESAQHIQAILQQLASGQTPKFVVQEESSSGYMLQRVIIDPSALSLAKNELLGKFLWIISPQRLLQPQTYTGEFWKRIRRFLPLKQSVLDITIKAYECAFSLLQAHMQFEFMLYSKPKDSLNLITLHNAQLGLREFVQKYDVTIVQTDNHEVLSDHIKSCILKIAPLLQDDKSLQTQINITAKNACELSQRIIADKCMICERSDARVIYMCCANSPCFNCFCKLASTSMGQLRCFVCRANLANPLKSKLISLFLDPQFVQFNAQQELHPHKSALLSQIKAAGKQLYDITGSDAETEIADIIFQHSRTAVSSIQQHSTLSIIKPVIISHSSELLAQARHRLNNTQQST